MGTRRRCTYSHTYSDVRTGADHAYQCPRPRWRNKIHCIFHSDAGASDSTVRDAFLDELRAGAAKEESEPMLFVGCRIPSITVKDVCTKRPVYFADARFEGDLIFDGVEFGAANFADAKFAGRLSMTSTKADVLSLRKASFSGERIAATADREGGDDRVAVELERCDFRSCDASLASVPSVRLSECDIGSAMFRYAQIGSLAVSDCLFKSGADFADSRLEDARFNGASFGGEAIFEDRAGGSVFAGLAIFRHTKFHREEEVRFGRSLSKVSFRTTNMTRIRFRADTVWNDDGDRYAILDERCLGDKPSSSSLSDTLAVYRSLRECYEYWLMYEEAGRLYAREMDIRRCYRSDASGGAARRTRWRRYLSLTNGYNVLCRYGESFGRASAWVGGVFGASAVYYALFGYQGDAGPPDGYSRIVESVERVLAAFLHTGRGGVDDHMVRIASLPVLGSMFIVLKRRLERKLRH